MHVFIFLHQLLLSRFRPLALLHWTVTPARLRCVTRASAVAADCGGAGGRVYK